MTSTSDERAGLEGSRVVMLAPPSAEMDSLARALKADAQVQCKILPPNVPLGELDRFDGARVVLAVPEALTVLQQFGIRRLLRWSYLFLLVDRPRLLGAADTLDLVDGVVFFDGTRVRADVLEMAMEGVVVIPSYLEADFSLDDLRTDQLSSLKLVELRVLRCLGEGLPNHLIGERLGIGEAKVKSAVRGLMVKLYFPNRTHAAIYAERAGHQLEAALVRLGGMNGTATLNGRLARKSIG